MIEAPFEIGIQDVFCLFVDLYIDGSDGIMTGTSRAKPIAVRLEFCLPFRF